MIPCHHLKLPSLDCNSKSQQFFYGLLVNLAHLPLQLPLLQIPKILMMIWIAKIPLKVFIIIIIIIGIGATKITKIWVARTPAEEVVALATMASVVGKVLAVAIADNSSNDKLLGNGHGSKVLLGLCRHVHIPHIVGPSPMQLKGHNSLVSLDPGHCKQHLMLSHPAW